MAETINNEELDKTENKSGNIEIIGECQEENEIANKSTLVTAHNMAFKFRIKSGIQPKSENPTQMNNWTRHTFKHDNYQITTTTKSIIVEINQNLGTGTINDLSLKYAKIAQVHAHNFAKEHNLTLGIPQTFRHPHFTIVQLGN